jgi:hypothetical protein
MKNIVIYGLFCVVAIAQDRVSVPFSDASRPRKVVASATSGCFAVEGYDGKEVTIESRPRANSERRQRHVPRGAEGLTRIDQNPGFSAEEENNTIRIHGSNTQTQDILLHVPNGTALQLHCTNDGDLRVDRFSGELDLQNINGSVTAANVSGSVIAHSLNGNVTVSVDRVTPEKPMSFSSLNGNIDVTLPPDTRGTVRMRTDNGEIYGDFEMKLTPGASKPEVEDRRTKGGRYRVKVDSTVTGTINGGGPDLSFKTFNGNIYLRKKK